MEHISITDIQYMIFFSLRLFPLVQVLLEAMKKLPESIR